MAHGLSAVTVDDVSQIVCAPPLQMQKGVRLLLWIILGIATVLFALGVSGPEAQKSWMTFHVNFTYWFIVAAASTCFASVLHLSNAQWARPIRRIFEASSSFLFYSAVPLVFLYFGHQYLFPWAREPVSGKEAWLSSNAVFIRDLIGILLLAYLARKVISYGLRRDLGVIHSGKTGISSEGTECWRRKEYQSYVSSWGENVSLEVDTATNSMWRLSPIVVMCYAVVTTLIAFDQIMSVDPHWYSTLFGAYYFMSGIYVAMAWAAIFVVSARELHPLFALKVEKRTLHDLGKLLFGFGIFWAYLFWSHYLTIWYGNIPEETHWVILRLREEPWHSFAWLVFGCCFLVPFLIGLSKDIKQIPRLLFVLAVIISTGLWLQQYLLFAPSVFPHEIPLSWEDLVVSLGFMAAYVLSVFSFLSKYPLMPFGDFYGTIPLEHK